MASGERNLGGLKIAREKFMENGESVLVLVKEDSIGKVIKNDAQVSLNSTKVSHVECVF